MGGQLSPRSQTGLPSGPPLPRRGGGQALPRRAAAEDGSPGRLRGQESGAGGLAGCGPATCGCGWGSPPLPLPEVGWSGSLGGAQVALMRRPGPAAGTRRGALTGPGRTRRRAGMDGAGAEEEEEERAPEGPGKGRGAGSH